MNKILTYTALLFLFFQTSCLKDDQYALDPANGHNVLEFLNVTAPISGYLDPVTVYTPGTFEAVEEVEFTLGINYAGPKNVAPQDIDVQLAVSPETLEKHNNEKSNKYELISADLYSFPSTVRIKKGEKTVKFQVKIKANKFDLSKSNALALAIVNSSYGVISSNGGSAIFSIPIKSIYDGVYKIEQLSPLVDQNVSTIVGYYPLDAELRTQSGTAVFMASNTYLEGGIGHPIKNGTAASYYGNFSPVFHFDAAHNVIAVTNYYGQGTNSNVRAAELDPTGENKFTFHEDGSKTLKVKYFMLENNAVRTSFHEQWTFEKSR